MKTGWESMWVGSIIYFIPFFFVLNPALVLQGPDPYLAGFSLMALAAFGTLFIFAPPPIERFTRKPSLLLKHSVSAPLCPHI